MSDALQTDKLSEEVLDFVNQGMPKQAIATVEAQPIIHRTEKREGNVCVTINRKSTPFTGSKHSRTFATGGTKICKSLISRHRILKVFTTD
jgi:hypothetical protein